MSVKSDSCIYTSSTNSTINKKIFQLLAMNDGGGKISKSKQENGRCKSESISCYPNEDQIRNAFKHLKMALRNSDTSSLTNHKINVIQFSLNTYISLKEEARNSKDHDDDMSIEEKELYEKLKENKQLTEEKIKNIKKYIEIVNTRENVSLIDKELSVVIPVNEIDEVKQLSNLKILALLFSIFLSFADVFTDIVLGIKYLINAQYLYGVLTLLVVMQGNLIVTGLVYFRKRTSESIEKILCWTGFHATYCYWRALQYLIRKNKSMKKEEEKDNLEKYYDFSERANLSNGKEKSFEAKYQVMLQYSIILTMIKDQIEEVSSNFWTFQCITLFFSIIAIVKGIFAENRDSKKMNTDEIKYKSTYVSLITAIDTLRLVLDVLLWGACLHFYPIYTILIFFLIFIIYLIFFINIQELINNIRKNTNNRFINFMDIYSYLVMKSLFRYYYGMYRLIKFLLFEVVQYVCLIITIYLITTFLHESYPNYLYFIITACILFAILPILLYFLIKYYSQLIDHYWLAALN